MKAEYEFHVDDAACQVYIVRRKDGDDVDHVAAKYLRQCDFVYSEKRRAYIACANGLPWSFAAFVPMHGLEVVEATISRFERSELGLYVPLEILRQEQETAPPVGLDFT